jgi:hypothetical protein
MDADELATLQTQPVRRPVLVWDAPVRLFHWLVVVLVTAAYVTLKLNWIDWPVRVGESLLALVIFRLLWGFFGSETAPFCSFVASAAAALRHLRRLFRREPDVQVGHNAAGGQRTAPETWVAGFATDCQKVHVAAHRVCRVAISVGRPSCAITPKRSLRATSSSSSPRPFANSTSL